MDTGIVEISDYEAQAQIFLAKTGTKLSIVYEKTAPYFPSDTESRGIYRCRLSRKGKGSYSFRFGQSYSKSHVDMAPTAYEILSCLTKSDPGEFRQFCRDDCYPEDSIALGIYERVLKEWLGMLRLSTDSEIQELQEIN